MTSEFGQGTMKPHILNSICFMSLWIGGCKSEEVFPFQSISSAEASGVDLPDAAEWKHFGTFGSNEGPFRNSGDTIMNAGRAGRIWFTVDGIRKEQDLSDLDSEVLVRGFVNPKGDSMAIVYTRRSSRE